MRISTVSSGRVPICLGALMLLVACRQKGSDELFPVLPSLPRAAAARIALSDTSRARSASANDSLVPNEGIMAANRAFLRDGRLEEPERLRLADSIVVVTAYKTGSTSIVGDTARVQFIVQTAGYLVADSLGSGSARRHFVAGFATETREYVARRTGAEWPSVRLWGRPFVFGAALSGRTDAFTLSPEDWKRIARLIRVE